LTNAERPNWGRFRTEGSGRQDTGDLGVGRRLSAIVRDFQKTDDIALSTSRCIYPMSGVQFGMNISLATESQLPALADIEKSAAQAFLDIHDLAWLAEGEVQPLERHRDLMHLGTNWVACDDRGKPVGFLSAEVFGNDLHIWELSVHRDHQGVGLGRSLMEKAIAGARLRRLKSVTLTTFRDVPWNAPFYQRLGFQRLDLQDTPERLRQNLELEKDHGMPLDRRCAMILEIVA
jgi:ribosomal protein S18 acetylase RimI-like enzyme